MAQYAQPSIEKATAAVFDAYRQGIFGTIAVTRYPLGGNLAGTLLSLGSAVGLRSAEPLPRRVVGVRLPVHLQSALSPAFSLSVGNVQHRSHRLRDTTVP